MEKRGKKGKGKEKTLPGREGKKTLKSGIYWFFLGGIRGIGMYLCMYICGRLEKGSREGRKGKDRKGQERKDTYKG